MGFIACEESEPEILTHVHNATIKINVFMEVSGGSGNIEEIPVQGASIKIYKTETDRDLDNDLVKEATTDSAGFAGFYNLEEEYYYIHCSHSTLGVQLDEVSTPDGTISFVDIIY